ncbi:MAG: serine hydrolase, partial [Rhodobacteraceae bacterium]|nr:serine hydrolase [Paracoccaceae bacterium]
MSKPMRQNVTYPNPDLAVGVGEKPGWNQPDRRRAAFHNLHQTVRYAQSFRAARIWQLRKDIRTAIGLRDDVRAMTALPCFSAMVVLRGDRVLYERYAADFGPDRAYSIMSISKTTMNLVIGRLMAEGRVDLSQSVEHYLPWIGPGYAKATVQQVLNMDVVNDYSEDYSDPNSRCFAHEATTGFRLPADEVAEGTMKSFLATIGLETGTIDCQNRSGIAQYKSANTDILACIAEVASGRAVSSFLADIADAAGIEGVLNVACDREGFAVSDGGICLTARDLARYGMIFARGGKGVGGQEVGCADFIARTLSSGVP